MKAIQHIFIGLLSAIIVSNSGCNKSDSSDIVSDVTPVEIIDACSKNYTSQNISIQDMDIWMQDLVNNKSEIMHRYDRPWADPIPRTYELTDIWKFEISNQQYYYYVYLPISHTGDNFMPKVLTYIYDCLGNQVCYDDHLLNLGCDFDLDYNFSGNSSDLFDYYTEQDLTVMGNTSSKWDI